MLIDINKIQIEDRIRKDYGDIEELAKDIKENGLINPPLVTPDNILIAGERRTRACKYLGYKQIEVNVMTVKNALHKLKLEISENENRKDFSFSEKMKWAKQLKDEYSKVAKEKQGNRNDLTSDKKITRIDSNKQVAKEVGFGNKETFRQAEYITENGDEELIKKLDEVQLSINKAYKTLKQEDKKRKPISKTIEKHLINRSNGKCEICGWGGLGLEGILAIHHKTPYSETQDNSLDNLIMVCPNCHKILHIIKEQKDENMINIIREKIGKEVYSKIKEII